MFRLPSINDTKVMTSKRNADINFNVKPDLLTPSPTTKHDPGTTLARFEGLGLGK